MKYKKIVVAIDLTDESEKILSAAKDIAGGDSGLLHTVYVKEPLTAVLPYESYVMEISKLEERISTDSKQQMSEIAAKTGIPEQNQHLLTGHPPDAICNYADKNNAQLIILGSHGKSGWRNLLGSTANSVVQSADCDVLTVRVREKKKE